MPEWRKRRKLGWMLTREEQGRKQCRVARTGLDREVAIQRADRELVSQAVLDEQVRKTAEPVWKWAAPLP